MTIKLKVLVFTLAKIAFKSNFKGLPSESSHFLADVEATDDMRESKVCASISLRKRVAFVNIKFQSNYDKIEDQSSSH